MLFASCDLDTTQLMQFALLPKMGHGIVNGRLHSAMESPKDVYLFFIGLHCSKPDTMNKRRFSLLMYHAPTNIYLVSLSMFSSNRHVHSVHFDSCITSMLRVFELRFAYDLLFVIFVMVGYVPSLRRSVRYCKFNVGKATILQFMH